MEAWFEPARENLEPSCQLCRASSHDGRGRLRLVASPDGRNETVSMRQDVFVYTARLDAGTRTRHFLEPDRAAWIQVLRGELDLNRRVLRAGDGASVESLRRLELLALEDCEVLLIDLP
jgi:hypothetical protein